MRSGSSKNFVGPKSKLYLAILGSAVLYKVLKQNKRRHLIERSKNINVR